MAEYKGLKLGNSDRQYQNNSHRIWDDHEETFRRYLFVAIERITGQHEFGCLCTGSSPKKWTPKIEVGCGKWSPTGRVF